MPYIPQDRRTAIDGGETPKTAGEWNYYWTRFLNREPESSDFKDRIRRAWYSGEQRYQLANDVVGALILACLERARRRGESRETFLLTQMAIDAADYLSRHFLGKYEDQKITENGDLEIYREAHK